MYLIPKTRVALNRLVLPLLKFPVPKAHVGTDSALSLMRIIAGRHERVLVVTDPSLVKLGVPDASLNLLRAQGVMVKVFDEVEPDPSYALIERGLEVLKSFDAQAIVAIGGGSTIDTAKAMSLSAANAKHPSQLTGLWLYALPRRAGIPLYAIPTTAGTGSEATVVSVLSDVANRTKVTIIEPKLAPIEVALDPVLSAGLPAPITAATGMDALTHAVEGYISTMALKETDAQCEEAVRLIALSLKRAYDDGSDMLARRDMLVASNLAGLAFTRAGVGYVHAIAHQLGALYHVPHGLANAIVLPAVLDFSREEASKRLTSLAEAAGVRGGADGFIAWVRDLNRSMGIPSKVAQLRESDFEHIMDRAFAEAHGTYGVPRYMTRDEMRGVLRSLMAN